MKRLFSGIALVLALTALVVSLPDIKRYIRISTMQRRVHELSIALSIIEGAEEEVVRQGGGRVHAVHLRLGPLSGVVKEALLFSYELACEGTSLSGSKLVIEEIPLLIECPQCRADRRPVSLQQLTCCQCGTAAAGLLTGAELEISALELES